MDSLKEKLTEEEIRELLGPTYNEKCIECNNMCIEIAKEKGYIKQNPVEKAERILNEYFEYINGGCTNSFIKLYGHYDIFKDAIDYLKGENNEHK